VTAPFAVPLSAALDRATELAGPAATLQAVRPLAGGSHANTYLVEIANPDRQMVLREFPMGDPAAANEERVLTALDGLGGLAPELLARGAGRDRPWVLITRMPGQADIVPDDPRAWAAQLGSTLARIHGTSAKTSVALDSVFERRGRDRLSGPAAEIVDAAWEQRILPAPPVSTHGDFQSGNVILDVLQQGIPMLGARREAREDQHRGVIRPRRDASGALCPFGHASDLLRHT